MKKFSLMLAFFTAVIVYNVFQDVKEPPLGAYEWNDYHKRHDNSIAKSLFISLVSSVVVYFGVSGFMKHLEGQKKN